MLTHLTAYHQYIDFLFPSLCYRDKYEYRFLDDDISKALFKMVQLDVDSIIPLLAAKYSHTGRPAKNQKNKRSHILPAHFRKKNNSFRYYSLNYLKRYLQTRIYRVYLLYFYQNKLA